MACMTDAADQKRHFMLAAAAAKKYANTEFLHCHSCGLPVYSI